MDDRIFPRALAWLALAALLLSPAAHAQTPAPTALPERAAVRSATPPPHIAGEVERAITHLEDGFGRLPRLAAHASIAQQQAGIGWFLKGDAWFDAEGRSIGHAIGQGLAALARALVADMVRPSQAPDPGPAPAPPRAVPAPAQR